MTFFRNVRPSSGFEDLQSSGREDDKWQIMEYDRERMKLGKFDRRFFVLYFTIL
jgi:hypothetical protein